MMQECGECAGLYTGYDVAGKKKTLSRGEEEENNNYLLRGSPHSNQGRSGFGGETLMPFTTHLSPMEILYN